MSGHHNHSYLMSQILWQMLSNLTIHLMFQKALRNQSAQIMLQKNNPSPLAEMQPAIVFNGCTFTGCAVALSGPSTSYYIGKEEMNVAETLEGITYNDIFDD